MAESRGGDAVSDVREGTKPSRRVEGAPFPPAERHDDGQAQRTRRDVPTAPAEPEPRQPSQAQEPTRRAREEECDEG